MIILSLGAILDRCFDRRSKAFVLVKEQSIFVEVLSLKFDVSTDVLLINHTRRKFNALNNVAS